MATISTKKNDIIIKQNASFQEIGIISNGSVIMSNSNCEYLLEKGNVIGIIDLGYESHSFDYIAAEDTSVIFYPCSNLKDLKKFFQTNIQLSAILFPSAMKQICDLLDSYVLARFDCENLFSYIQNSYQDYLSLCAKHNITSKILPGLEEYTSFQLEDELEEWISPYYDNIKKMALDGMFPNISAHSDFLIGFLLKAGKDIHALIQAFVSLNDYKEALSYFLLNESSLDYFDLYSSLLFKAMHQNQETSKITTAISKLMIHIENIDSIDLQLYRRRIKEYKLQSEKYENGGENEISNHPSSIQDSSLSGSLDLILTYSTCQKEFKDTLKRLIEQYKKVTDKTSSDDTLRLLRKNITTSFYELYKNILLKSFNDKNIPTIVQMFLKFGFIDEELAGIDNTSYLYSIAENFHGDGQRIFTISEWLFAIYNGKKEPSRNDFDLDYQAYLLEQKASGKIDDATMKQLLTDTSAKVSFEIQNMFSTANRMTSGKILSFCPILSEEDFVRDLSTSLTTTEKLLQALEKVRSIDYSAFYREVLYTNPDIGVSREYVALEILPNIILMPNMGSRGVMWQEIEGKKRNTPATLVLSAFCVENIELLMIRMTAEYRYEICRRIQGARWNDISTPSLTSEYSDYLQFYKKNNDLSTEAKAKLKTLLQKAKNSYKEVFVQDYIQYILYESSGSPRLNKIARKIIYQYCPLSVTNKKTLENNPLYLDLFRKENLQRSKELTRLQNLFHKIQKAEHPIPDVLLSQLRYIEQL